MSSSPEFKATRATRIHSVHYPEMVDSESDVEVNVRYVNRTLYPIVITRRDGLRFIVKPHTRKLNTDDIGIYVTLKGPVDVIKNTLRRLNDDTNPSSQERLRWIKSLDRQLTLLNKDDKTVVTATVEYMLSSAHLDELGGRAYMTDQDIMIEWYEHDQIPLNHPFCQAEQDAKSMDAIFTNCGKESLVLLFRAIDNTGRRQYSDRYVNVAGKVYRIPIETDKTLKQGIHVTTRRSVDNHQHIFPGELATEHYEFDVADKLFDLHLTVEDAVNGGPMTEVIKEKLNHQAAAQKLREAELRHAQLLMDEEFQRARFERDMRRSDMDNKANTQKLVLEWVKTLATLITAGLGLYAAFRKVVPAQ